MNVYYSVLTFKYAGCSINNIFAITNSLLSELVLILMSIFYVTCSLAFIGRYFVMNLFVIQVHYIVVLC